MNFKDVLIVTDMDGTLLDDDKNIAADDIAAINEFRAGGGLFAAATGRGVAMAKRIIDELGIVTPSVIFNGAAVYDFAADRFLWHSDMPDIANTYIRMLEKEFPDIGVEILHEKEVYVTNNNQTVVEHMAFEKLTPVYRELSDVPGEGRLKVLIAYPPEKMQRVIEFTQEHCMEGVNWVHSSPMYYEMLPEGISKASGVRRLRDILHFQDKFIVAAGDYGNDKAMIEEADLGVAVANALDSVKEAADLIVRDNNSSPMREIIEYVRKLPERDVPGFRRMRRFKQEVSRGECVRILTEEKRGVLGVNGDNGYPYAVPVNFYYDSETEKIYFHCAKAGHKLDAMLADDRVCFTVYNTGYRKEDWSYYVTSVIVFGRAKVMTDRDEMLEKIRSLGLKYYPTAPEVDEEIRRDFDRVNMVEITIEQMTGKFVHEK